MGEIFNFSDYYTPTAISNKKYKNNVIDFNTYKSEEIELTKEDHESFRRYLELWDRFYDYVGQDLYDRIKAREEISMKELNSWGCKDSQEFLNTWRGNSEEEFSRWLKENGYEL